MQQQDFIARDGRRLVCTLWADVKKPVGVVQLIHGMDEHARRYDRFAKFMNRHGFIVFGDDHRAHGLTAKTPRDIGRVGNATDLFMETVSDELEILEYLKHKFKLPVFLFGHSYGSFITQKIMEQTDLCTAGVCLSGSALYPPAMAWMAASIAWIGMKLWGADAPARFIEFFSPIRGTSGGISRLSRDPAQVAAHDADPLRAKYFSYGFYYSFFKNVARLTHRACTSTPLLIISGGHDLVSMNSRLARSLYNAYQSHDMDSLTIIIYPDARHELLMDLGYRDVQRDILAFFTSALRRGAPHRQ